MNSNYQGPSPESVLVEMAVHAPAVIYGVPEEYSFLKMLPRTQRELETAREKLEGIRDALAKNWDSFPDFSRK